MNLRRKMLLGYGVAFALMALVMVWGALRLSELGSATDSILSQNYRSIDASWRMREALDRQIETLLTDTTGAPVLSDRFRSTEADFLYWLGKARDNITVPGEEATLAGLDSIYGSFLDAAAAVDPTRVRQGYAPDLEVAADAALAADSALDRLLLLNQAAMYSTSERARRMAADGMSSTLVIGGIALATGILFSILLSGRILRPLYQTIQAARRLAGGDYSIRVADGGRDELGSLASEFNAMAGQLERFESLHVDGLIAEKSKTEAILNGIDDGIVLVDSEMRVLDMNPAATGILGAGVPGRTRALHLSEIVGNEKLLAEVLRVAGGAVPAALTEEERTVEFPDGQGRRFLQYAAMPLEHSGRVLPGCVLVLRDVTRAREADRQKSEFVMAAAHELRTPVTGIGMSLDLLHEHLSGTLGEREKDLLESARDEMRRLKALIGDLLDLSRIEAGRIDLEPEVFEPGMLFQRIAAIFEGQVAMRNARLEISTEQGLAVLADPGKTAWVLSNMVSNSLRYLPGEGGTIALGARRAGMSVQISVADNGAGIPLEYQSRIFQKFARFDIDGRNGGSGLGLAICREVVRASGGTVWVESAPGQGTTFIFTLPAAGRDGNA